MRLSLFVCCLGFWININAQAPEYAQIVQQARQEIDSLCSLRLAGRGYINDGHIKAANYISKRFREIGLEPIVPTNDGGATYQQKIPIRINRIRNAKLIMGKDTLTPGKDFIVHRLSGGGGGKWKKVKDMDYGLKGKKSVIGKIAIIRDGWPEDMKNDTKKQEKYGTKRQMLGRINAIRAYQPAGFVILKSKLTAAFAGEHMRVPIVEVLADRVPDKVKKAYLEVDASLASIETQNVLGLVRGTKSPDTTIVISAHYDHLGMLGDAIFPGANDNASGTAILLSMAAYFKENPIKYSVLFIAFGGEETGLNGSRYYVEYDPVIPLSKLKFILNLDLMGNGDEGIMAVGGRDFPQLFDLLKQSNEELSAVPDVRARVNAPNSDHFFFLLNGVPGFFVYTMGGPPHYHDVNDSPENIRLSKFGEVRELLIRFVERL